MTCLRYLYAAICLLIFSNVSASADALDEIDKTPVIGGAIRTRYEYDMTNRAGRFQVRNARVSFSGSINKIIGYYTKVDLCDRGYMKILDAFGKFNVSPWLRVQIGRQSIPFSVDASRSPGTYYFSRHSYVEEFVGAIRGVGIQGLTSLYHGKVYVDAGIFQIHTADQTAWSRQRYDYVGRIGFKPGNIKLEAGMESTVIASTRINMFDASINWRYGRWMVECEGLAKCYTHSSYHTAWASNMIVDYAVPVNSRCFNQWSLQGRYDCMSDHSNGSKNDAGMMITDIKGQYRITLGSTLNANYGKLKTELRINYEKNFNSLNYRHAVAGNGNKLLAEMVIIF